MRSRPVGVDRRKVGFLKVWKVVEDFILSHTGRQHIQYVAQLLEAREYRVGLNAAPAQW
jgi:hypothetical protein